MTRSQGDQPARDRIRTDLATNMLVEAGAGSGKTTALVERMLQHVLTGTPVERLAAVTFTRKAATELRERFQMRLERAVRESPGGSDVAERAERALRELNRAFLGTIHSFCARLLRERPLEVALDPNFQEVSDGAWIELRARFWRRWVERARRERDADLRALYSVGIDPAELAKGFEEVMTYPEVHFPLTSVAPPDVTTCRRELETLLAVARPAMPTTEPADGWDDLMRLVRRLEFRRSVGDFSDRARFCDVLDSISAAHCKVVQKRWSDDKTGKTGAKALGEAFAELVAGPVAEVLRCWREHRYPIVMRVLLRATAEFSRERHATGQLGFEDLLLLTAKLLREHPAVREELGARYAHLMVDEFQDTDPIQAEVCFLLTSDPREGDDWRTVTPRAGSLFVVGDPKQSIYRFRRADIQIYELVRQRMATFGTVLRLTTNFRSVSAIEAVVNGHFESVFPAEATAEQAAYSPMETVAEPDGADGVYRYVIRPEGKAKEEIVALDAGMVASWIAGRIARGERQAGDFLILTATKHPIEAFARALSERNVAAATTGARLPQEHELRELLVVLRAITDPENAIAVVAALEGLFFGLSPADLWDGSRRGVRFALTHRPADEAHRVGRALLQLHAWWQWSQRHPADVLLERILDDTGLLLHAAGLPLGDARAGALLHLVESLRSASVAGANALSDAMERLHLLLDAEATDAPLRPGRIDAVRVMNVHKAKGLEADVVILAAPVDRSAFEPTIHVLRGARDEAIGGIRIASRRDGGERVLAQPPAWAEMQAAETRFQDAEQARLLYVAATRAKRELLVAQCEKTLARATKPDEALWRPLAPTLEERSFPLSLEVTSAPGRRVLARTAASLARAVEATIECLGERAHPSLRFSTVTEDAKGHGADFPGERTSRRATGAGMAWGSAVHRSIEALGRGRRGDSLRTFVRAVAAEEGLPPEHVASLVAMMERIAGSALWGDLVATDALRVELTVMRSARTDGVESITEGVIDAATLGPEGWRIVDWKTDQADDRTWSARHEIYMRQVEAYVGMLAELSGRAARGAVERLHSI